MKRLQEKLTQSSKSQVKEVERRHLHKVDNYSQLKAWVQSVILKAEKNKDYYKRKRFERLLADLQMPRINRSN